MACTTDSIETHQVPESIRESRFHGLSRLAVTVIETLLTWQDRFNQRHHLAGLDDHALKDMGLSRGDVEREASKGFWRA